jgi:hypothetical protein
MRPALREGEPALTSPRRRIWLVVEVAREREARMV